MSAFIVLEGGEGSGKTSVIAALTDHLRGSGREVVVTREPGGTPMGEAIRTVLLAGDEPMTPRCEALLFAAARAEHAERVIRPALLRGEWVLCDRYIDSSLAYQGAARGLDLDDVRELSRWGTRALEPDLTIVLDIDPVVGLGRAKDANRMEALPVEFHEAVRLCFLELAAADPSGHVVLDANQPFADVVSAARSAIDLLAGAR